MMRHLPRTAASLAAAACVAVPLVTAPGAAAKNGDTHVTGTSVERTIDCNESLLLVNGTNNTIYAKGVCWAVTVQGSGNTVVADTIINDVTVYGWNQTVLFHNGAPALIDRGRELGMTNRISWVPA